MSSSGSTKSEELSTNIPYVAVVLVSLATFGVGVLVTGILLYKRHQRKLREEDTALKHGFSVEDYGFIPRTASKSEEKIQCKGYNNNSREQTKSSLWDEPPQVSPYGRIDLSDMKSRESLTSLVMAAPFGEQQYDTYHKENSLRSFSTASANRTTIETVPLALTKSFLSTSTVVPSDGHLPHTQTPERVYHSEWI